MIDQAGIEELIDRTREEVESRAAEVLQQFPMQTYLDSIGNCPDYPGVSSVVRERSEKIEGMYDKHIQAGYQKLALLMLIGGSLQRIRNDNMPSSIGDLCLDGFERVLTGLPAKPDDYYSYQNPAFVDDVRWCSMQTIPIGGAWMIEVSAVRKKHLVGGGIRNFFSFLFFVLFKLRGRGPVYRIHTLKRYSGGFTREERTRCYLRIVELLRQNRDVKGLYVLGWLYDPKLSDISPELTYLRELPERNGARLFRYGTTEQSVPLATAFSAQRRALYREGKYTPTDYALIWPRREMLRWAMAGGKDEEADS